MNKNWNDRADKDLFFTILSVKNIGVISGAEWTAIGGHMRGLGYGFTNEGCRQHFQGLRRAQHKADTSVAASDGLRNSDPAMNPITRRPGPGRGRPRKQAPAPVILPVQAEKPEPAVQPPPPAVSQPAAQHQQPRESQPAQGLEPPPVEPTEVPSRSPLEAPTEAFAFPRNPLSPSEPALSVGQAPEKEAGRIPGSKPEPVDDQESENIELLRRDLDENNQDDIDHDDLDTQPAKRPKFDHDPHHVDDSAVLALAVENHRGSSEPYGPPEYFDEA